MTDLIEIFTAQFQTLEHRWFEILHSLPEERLFERPQVGVAVVESRSAGELLLRSAARIEQTFGGLMTRLWDDPFEWTLPEELSTRSRVAEYLNEVVLTRKKGLAFFASDAEFYQRIPAPEVLTPIAEVLLKSLIDAAEINGRAAAAAGHLVAER